MLFSFILFFIFAAPMTARKLLTIKQGFPKQPCCDESKFTLFFLCSVIFFLPDPFLFLSSYPYQPFIFKRFSSWNAKHLYFFQSLSFLFLFICTKKYLPPQNGTVLLFKDFFLGISLFKTLSFCKNNPNSCCLFFSCKMPGPCVAHSSNPFPLLYFLFISHPPYRKSL